MGMFDTVKFKCPNCEAEMSAQSKTGDCLLETYNTKAVPDDVACGLGKSTCQKCGKTFQATREKPVVIYWVEV